MSWKAGNLPTIGHEKNKTLRPHKLPSMKRGGGLRVGRVVSDARSGNNDSRPGNQLSSTFVQEEERRVQDELIEILTVKLANKEKEVELLKVKQSEVDRELSGHNDQIKQRQKKHTQVVDEMTATNQELHRQVQLLQIQCEQLQVESETHRIAATEQRRLREKDQAQVRLDSRAHQKTNDDLQRQLHRGLSDRSVLEDNIQNLLRDQQEQSKQVAQLEDKCALLELAVQSSDATCQQLQEALSVETQKREGAESHARRINEEKVALEEKHRALAKTLKGASARAVDVEKKRSVLARAEDQLTQQLAILQKENLELKARKGQIASQTKHLQARIAALESSYAVQDKKLEDAAMELESARKYCRDSQFRVKQLQEEIVFLKNRKGAVTESEDKPPPAQQFDPQNPAKLEVDDEVPVWMKE